jgi:hypothetical protein
LGLTERPKILLLLITSVKNGLTDEDELQQEVEYADLENTPFRNAIDLHQFQLYPLRRQHGISKSSSTSKSAFQIHQQTFNGDIFQWQPFWQALCAEINDDHTL